jgi:molybdenum cofactor cytidylyltransferase
MNLARALRQGLLSQRVISLVGAGGKTTALFQLANQLLGHPSPTVIVTATSHLGAWQAASATQHVVAKDVDQLSSIFDKDLRGVILFTGEIKGDRFLPIDALSLNWLREKSDRQNIPFLIEADGSREHALKAPAAHEPPIPHFTDTVLVIVGLSALGKSLSDEHVHRAAIYAQLGELPLGRDTTPESILKVLLHSQGGMKNIPPNARRVAFLNQADTPELQSIAGSMADELLDQFDSVIVGSLRQGYVETIERTAGIILAAGESTRFGAPKQLLDWHGKPFVRQVAETALHASLRPVVVVTGAHAPEVNAALNGLPVRVVHNPEFAQGQSTSIKKGVESLPSSTGASIFLLADQPQIPVDVILALKDAHARELPAILAPLVLDERRANPVLFDRAAFADLMQLTGDTGGRAIFDKHRVEYLPWHDDILLFDVDKPEDYQRLKDLE